MSVLDVAMLVIAIVLAVVVGLQVFKLARAIRVRKQRRKGRGADPASEDVLSEKDRKGE